MRKIFRTMMAIAIAATTFTACEDVPAPYDIPGTGSSTAEPEQTEGIYLSEAFSTSFGSFTNVTVKGTPWVIDYKTAKATGYDGSSTTPSEAYLVSSPIDLSKSNRHSPTHRI